MGEPVRVVLGDRQVGDAELHPRGVVVGTDGRHPYPWRLAVGQRRHQRLSGFVVTHGGGAVGGGDLDLADLCPDGRGARGDRDGRFGDRVVEVDLQPLTDRGLQCIGHPAGRLVAVNRRGRGGGPRKGRQRGGGGG